MQPTVKDNTNRTFFISTTIIEVKCVSANDVRPTLQKRDSVARYEGGRMNRALYVQATPYRAVEIKVEGQAKICRAEK